MDTNRHVLPGGALTGRRRGLSLLALSAAIVLLSASLRAHARFAGQTKESEPGPNFHDDPRLHPHLGTWVTANGQIRHELLPNGRDDEQRGQRLHACQGRYRVKGNRIAYLDDTGFTADGVFRDGRFLHGGYVFLREKAQAAGTK